MSTPELPAHVEERVESYSTITLKSFLPIIDRILYEHDTNCLPYNIRTRDEYLSLKQEMRRIIRSREGGEKRGIC